METFSASLALCAGNSPVIGEFSSQRPVTRSFDVFFDGWVNNREAGDFRRHCAHYYVIVMNQDYTSTVLQLSVAGQLQAPGWPGTISIYNRYLRQYYVKNAVDRSIWIVATSCRLPPFNLSSSSFYNWGFIFRVFIKNTRFVVFRHITMTYSITSSNTREWRQAVRAWIIACSI